MFIVLVPVLCGRLRPGCFCLSLQQSRCQPAGTGPRDAGSRQSEAVGLPAGGRAQQSCTSGLRLLSIWGCCAV